MPTPVSLKEKGEGKREKRKKSERKAVCCSFITISMNTRLAHYGSSFPRTKKKALLPRYCTSQGPDKVRSLCKPWFLMSGDGCRDRERCKPVLLISDEASNKSDAVLKEV